MKVSTDIAITNQVRVMGIRLDGSSHGALGAAIIKYGHDPLKTPLLALGHELLGCTRR